MSLPQPNASIDQLLELDNQLCFALYAASRTVVRAYAERLSAFSLTYPQYLVLLVLWEWDRTAPERQTVRALGERLDLDSGTLTPLLRRLEAKGLVTRQRGRADERELCIAVTSDGRALKSQISEIPRQMLSTAPLTVDELVDLRERLNRLRSGVAA